MRFSIAAIAFASVALSTSLAAAQAPGQTMSFDTENPPGAAAPAQLQTETVNYRGQIIAADVASLGLMLAGPTITHDPTISSYGFTGYLLAAPIVHAAHGQGRAAIKSLALRGSLPWLGGTLGYFLGPHDTTCIAAQNEDGSPAPSRGCGGMGSLIGLVVGAGAGGVAAMVIDAKYLPHYTRTRTAPSWSASIQPMRGGASVGVAGMF